MRTSIYATWPVTNHGLELDAGQTLNLAFPDSGIWLMLLIGFVGVCSAFFRRGRKDRLASPFGEDMPRDGRRSTNRSLALSPASPTTRSQSNVTERIG
jgi:hypothetical protein